MTAKEMAKYMASEENFIFVERDTFYAIASEISAIEREIKRLKIILETIDKDKNM